VWNSSYSTAVITPGQILNIALDPAFSNLSVIEIDPVNCPVSVVGEPSDYERTVRLDGRCVPGQSYVVGVRATPTESGPYLTRMGYVDYGECSGDKIYSIKEWDNCSCDPNALTVQPAGCEPNGNVVMDQRLTYKIRFENVGTGIAHNIVITDQLDTDLDEATAAVITSSHTVTGVQLDPGNVLAIRFDGIDLPGIGDPDNNKGFVVFTVDPKPALLEGTVIQNTAEIVFDLNTPVVTNTTENTLYADPCPTLAVQLMSFSAIEREGYIEVEWATATEHGTAGFNLYRSEGETGEKILLNDALISAAGDELAGAQYSFRDYDYTSGADYYYWFEDVGLEGETNMNASVQVERRECPAAFSLSQNAPNPFNPVTEIRYTLAADCHVRLVIYNVLGQKVATLVNDYQHAGYRVIHWYGKNADGLDASSGIYFYKLEAGNFTDTKKMILLR
jgi:uncharacterized repeat protein (TIGR01451 family)